MGGVVEAVELEVDVDAERGERGREARVAREPDAVGVEHHERDPARLRGGQHVEDLRVDRRLAARQLHRLRLPLRGDERVQHRLDLRERQRVAVGLMPGARLGEADRAVEVAAGVDLDDPEARVLGVLGADAAVARAALAGRGLAQQRRRARPVVALRVAPARRCRRTRAPRSGRARGTRDAGSRARRGRSAPRRGRRRSAGRSTGSLRAGCRAPPRAEYPSRVERNDDAPAPRRRRRLAARRGRRARRARRPDARHRRRPQAPAARPDRAGHRRAARSSCSTSSPRRTSAGRRARCAASSR